LQNVQQTSLVMTGLMHSNGFKTSPGEEALMLTPFIVLLGLIPGGTSPSCKTAKNMLRCNFQAAKLPKCRATRLPKYSKTAPSCQVMKLPNLRSCRAAELPSCQSVEAAELQKTQAAEKLSRNMPGCRWQVHNL
jgi:hypothetical protein